MTVRNRTRLRLRILKAIVYFAAIWGFAVFIYYSPHFEREKPKIDVNSTIYWNFKTPFTIKASDNEALGDYKIELKDVDRKITIAEGKAPDGARELNISLVYPKNTFLPQGKEARLAIEVKDRSFWSFFRPNSLEVDIPVICDKTPPMVSTISNSYSIARGGSAAVVFEAKDSYLKEVYIKTSSGRIFNVQPFIKKGFYVALIAWELQNEAFSASIVATDMAGNKAVAPIKYFLRDVPFKDTKLELKDDFLNAKIVELSSSMHETTQTTSLDRFVYVNNTLREANEKLIEQVTTRIGDNTVSGFFETPFLPIKNASVVGSFGDKRSYYIGDKPISVSYHKGVDFASVKEDVIAAPNDGVVMFAAPNGIYGNMSILYHGLGLFTLYGHCSSFSANVGDVVKRGQPIAKTGVSGLAFGDHLHYGVLIQGVEVKPVEWLDPHWIKLNVTNILNEARYIITGVK